jgi:hypothetical protein
LFPLLDWFFRDCSVHNDEYIEKWASIKEQMDMFEPEPEKMKEVA